MNCKQAREYLFDFDTGQAPAAAQEHLSTCVNCASELASLRKTMSLLDGWHVPEPSPYFDSRLRARLREQSAVSVGWWQALRRPAMALAVVMVVAGGVLIHGGRGFQPTERSAHYTVLAPPGTAVGDLQSLDKNHDLLATIELLDDVAASDQDDELNP